ncbi:hypothetical protein [Nonomuraea sp. LPB2021202275-12-8]
MSRDRAHAPLVRARHGYRGDSETTSVSSAPAQAARVRARLFEVLGGQPR